MHRESSDGLWYADLYHTQLQIDYLKDDAPADLWQQYLLYLPDQRRRAGRRHGRHRTAGPGRGPSSCSVDELLNEMSSFMIDDVYQAVTHNYFVRTVEPAIAAHKEGRGGQRPR